MDFIEDKINCIKIKFDFKGRCAIVCQTLQLQHDHTSYLQQRQHSPYYEPIVFAVDRNLVYL